MLIELPGRKVEIANAVAEAVYLTFGGVTAASRILGITPQGIYKHLQAGHVATRTNAEKWAAATRKAGRPIPATELIGLVPWSGPERDTDGDGQGRKSLKRARPGSSSGSTRSGTLHAAPAPAMAVGWR